MVPVLRDADSMSFADIEKAIAGFGEKARDGTITVDDLQGGTFTITNGGIFGSLLSTPILNPPQSAILGMHAIKKRPVVVDDQIVIRPMMYLALSYDHRIIDGREAVSFLVRIKECIEDPERMMLALCSGSGSDKWQLACRKTVRSRFAIYCRLATHHCHSYRGPNIGTAV